VFDEEEASKEKYHQKREVAPQPDWKAKGAAIFAASFLLF